MAALMALRLESDKGILHVFCSGSDLFIDFVDLDYPDCHLVHPVFDWNAAGQTGLSIRDICCVNYRLFVLTWWANLLCHPVEPRFIDDDLATA